MEQEFNFARFCEQYLKDASLGHSLFYKDHQQTYCYKDLMSSVIQQIDYFKRQLPNDQFIALKCDSSYHLFIHLLAGIYAHKEVLIVSNKEPEAALSLYQKTIPFTRIITDADIKKLDQFELTELPELKKPLSESAFFILSSGSSGPSKAIGLSLNNVYYSAKSTIDFFRTSPIDATFLNLPHHHIGGLMILWRAFFSHSSVTVNEEDNYQFISLVPLQLKRFLQMPDKKKKLQQCRAVLIGGAPLESQLKTSAVNENINLYETYGMSETSSLVMLNGVPLAGQTVKLDSQQHFLIKGPTLSPGVVLDDEGFFLTKDVGTQNTDGSFSFKYRSDILFKSAGEMIDPLFIEEKVKSLPWISSATVVPIDHPEWTRAAALIYQSSDDSKLAEDIKSYLKTQLHPHLVPRYFYQASQNLMPEGMKPKRYEIKKWAQEEYFQDLFHYQYFPAVNPKSLMVFFHGFMEDHTDMINLTSNDHNDAAFLFIDLPGHGKTKISPFKSREHIFESLTSLIKFLKNDQDLIFYGYSMGGRIALELAAGYIRPTQLILESAHFGLTSLEEKKSRLESDRKLLRKPGLDLKVFFSNWYQNPIFANYNKSANFEMEINKKLQHDPSEWQSALEFFSPGATNLFESDLITKLQSLNILAIAGSDDEKYKNHFLDIKNKMENFTYYEIAHAGHNPHKTHLNEIKNILRKFT